MRRFVFILLIVAFCTIYYYATLSDSDSFARKSTYAVQDMFNKVTISKASSPAASRDDQTASTDDVNTTQVNGVQDLGAMSEAEFTLWVRREARPMDSVQNSTEQIEVRLSALARTLQAPQIQVLKQLALNTAMPVNERILSSYLITLALPEVSTEVLVQVAQTEMPDLGPVHPHSEAELKRGQELALRYMQVDELFERAKTNAYARNQLRLLSTQAKSEEVRHYAIRKFNELK